MYFLDFSYVLVVRVNLTDHFLRDQDEIKLNYETEL